MFFLTHRIIVLISLITFLLPVLTKQATTNQLNTNLTTTHQRMKRPVTNRISTSVTQQIRNSTNPQIIERIIITSTTATNLSKLTNNKTRTTTTKTPIKETITNNVPIGKTKNSSIISKNITTIQQSIKSVLQLNNTNEFHEQTSNEKNTTSIVNSTMDSEINSTSTITPDMSTTYADFYLDPVHPDPNDDMMDSSIGISNFTEGFDSFLINENINAFTTGTTLCPKCKCGVKTLRKIVGGDVTKRNEYPWTAILTYNQQFFCVGSLINNLYVVTAAHCTTTFKKDNIMVNFQDIKKDNENSFELITRKIANVYRPIHYNQNTFYNDVSLIKLSEPVDISTGLIRPICLPIDKTSFVGKIGTITGWRINRQNGISLHLARVVNTTVLSNRQCRKTLVGKLISPTMICSSTSSMNHSTECRGDSGGALMITQKGRSRLAGIVSWGLGCTKKNAADVFTRTTKFNGWLRQLSQGACWCN